MKKKVRHTRNTLGSLPNHHRGYGPEINRRGFLKTGVGLAALAALPLPVQARRLRSIDERRYDPITGILDTTLDVQFAENRIGPGRRGRIYTRTYEGTIPGPVLRVPRGGMLRVLNVNSLPAEDMEFVDVNIPHGFNSTNLHTHGFNVAPWCDDVENPTLCSDNVLVEIGPGEYLQYEYDIPSDHADGTFWYHPHRHGSVAFQMMGGMGGALIVEGPTDDFLNDRGITEQILVFQQIRVKEAGEVQFERFQDVIDPPQYTVNGQLRPIIRMRAGEVQRWRFIHAGMSEHIPLELRRTRKTNPQTLYQLACDGITLPQLEPVKSVFMASGNRVDVLVEIDKPGLYHLVKPEFDQGFVEGPVPEELLARVIVSGRSRRPQRLNQQLPELDFPTTHGLTPLQPITDEEIDNHTRRNPGEPHRILTFAFDGSMWNPLCIPDDPDCTPLNLFPKLMIGGRYRVDESGTVVLQGNGDIPGDIPQQFDPDRVDQVIKHGAVEEWTVLNLSPIDHPFHIHQVPFFVTEIVDPRPNRSGTTTPNKWQDVQNIPGGRVINPDTFEIEPGRITFRIRFDGGNPDKGGIAGRFVLHCHILDHEDLGMMQLVEVIE